MDDDDSINMDALAESITLLNAQLSFLDTHVALIHIPLSLYPMFVQPILQLLLHNNHLDSNGQRTHQPHRPWLYWHPFVNISLTPHECSIVCPRHQAETLFSPILAHLSSSPPTAKISREDYSVIAIGGPGMDAGARVLDLSSPLAMAGIPIFFITSYYSDYILVPYASRQRVIRALETRGFVFQKDAPDGEGGQMTNPASPLFAPNHHQHAAHSPSAAAAARKNSVGSLFDFPQPSLTPPASSLAELQTRTFALLRKHGIVPSVDRATKLVTCGGYKDVTVTGSSNHFTAGKLMLGLVRCFTLPPRQEKTGDLEERDHNATLSHARGKSHELSDGESVDGEDEPDQKPDGEGGAEPALPGGPPKFLSLTLTDTDSLSVTLETRLLPLFHNAGEDLLLGKDGPIQVPVTLDLAELPLESTGIVCGVASRVSDGMKGRIGREGFDLSYLSTARAGHVVVYEEELGDAVEALEGLGQ